MYKVHRPHLHSGYLMQVQYAASTDSDGQPDWLLHYTPGPKARTEYAAFMRQPGADAAAALTLSADAQEDLMTAVTYESPAALPPSPAVAPAAQVAARPAPLPEPPSAAASADLLRPQADALVRQFYQRFHGLAQVTPSPKELAHAAEILATHGAAKAHFLVAFASQVASETHYQPQAFGGIRHYLPRALAAYDAQTVRATQAATQRAVADARTQREQHQAWEQCQLAQLRTALLPEALAALEAEARANLIAAGTPAVALPLAVRVAVDQVLAAQAGLPAFEAWQQTQEVS